MDSMTFNSRFIVNCNFFLLIIVSIILPPLYPKKIFFFIAMVFFALSLISKSKITLNFLSPIAFNFILIMYLCAGTFGDVNFELAIQFCFASLMLVLSYVVMHFNIDINKHLKYAMLVLVVIVYYVSLGYFGFIVNLPYSTVLVDVFISYKLGFIGERQFGGLVLPMLHFVSSPVLLILSSLYIIDNKNSMNIPKYFVLLSFFGAIYFSGSRGIFVFSFLCSALLLIYFSSKYIKVLVSLILLIFLFFIFFSFDLSAAFDFKEQSISIKFGHFISYLDYVGARNFIMGDGLASYYFTSGFSRMAAMTELMLFDFLRYFGFLNTLALLIVLIFPICIVRGRFYFVSPFTKLAFPYFITFIFYLLMAMTNPMLLNSYGMLVVVWYWVNILRVKNLAVSQIGFNYSR